MILVAQKKKLVLEDNVLEKISKYLRGSGRHSVIFFCAQIISVLILFKPVILLKLA
jgi:hypothetical protein